MTTDQPDSSPTKTPGRGVELFFGESDAAEAEAARVEYPPRGTAETKAEPAAQASPVAAQGETPVAVVAPPPSPSPAPPPPAGPPSQPVLIQSPPAKGGNGCLMATLGALFGAMLGVLLTLGFLLLTNQGLSYASRSKVDSLQATVTAYERGASTLRGDLSTVQGSLSGAQSQLSQLQQGLSGLQSTLESQGQTQSVLADEVTGVAGRVETIEDQVLPMLQDDVLGLQESVDEVSGAVETVASDVVTLTQRVDTVSASAERAQRFLAGMQALLASVLADEPLTPTPVPTRTAPLTATIPVTVTPTITVTAPVTPGLQIPLTATLEITVTATPSPTLAPTTTPVPEGGVIRGVVYQDVNRNGARDADSEPGIANVRVTLYTQNRTEVARTTTNLRGEYEFTGLNPGIYVVVETDPPGFASSTPNVLTVVLRSNRPAENVNFGDYR